MSITKTIDLNKHPYLLSKTGDQFQERDIYRASISGRLAFDLLARGKEKKDELKVDIKIQKMLEKVAIPLPPDYRPGFNYQPIFLLREWTADVGLNLIYSYGRPEDTSFRVQLQKMEYSGKVYTFGNPIMSLQKTETPVTLICEILCSGRDVHFYQVAFQLDMLICFAGYAL